MSKLKSIMLYGLQMAMLADQIEDISRGYKPRRNQTETPDDRKRRLQLAEIKSNQAKGLKQFYNGKVWALNQKSADKKAKKLGII